MNFGGGLGFNILDGEDINPTDLVGFDYNQYTNDDNGDIQDPVQTTPKVVNVVSTFQLNVELDLHKIVQKARNAEYNPKRFAGAIMRISSPKSTALIFKTGKIVCTGTSSVEESKIAAKKYARNIKKIGYAVKFSNFKIQNIVGSCDVKFHIRLSEILTGNPQLCQYEPEVFPGLVYRLPDPKVTLLIFSTGKLVLTGAKEEGQLEKAYRKIYPLLAANRNDDNKN